MSVSALATRCALAAPLPPPRALLGLGVRFHRKPVAHGTYKMKVRGSVKKRLRVTGTGAIKRWQMGHRHRMRVRSGRANAQKAAAMVVSTNNKNYIKACKMLGVSTKMGRWTPPKAPNTPRTPTTLWERVAAGEHLRA